MDEKETLVRAISTLSTFAGNLETSNQAITLAQKTAVKVHDDTIVIDPTLLFQRLIKVAETTGSLADYFSFELTNIRTALFDTSGLMRLAKKSVLAQYTGSLPESIQVQLPQQAQYVIDCGSLLHKLPRLRGSTFKQLLEMYLEKMLQGICGV